MFQLADYSLVLTPPALQQQQHKTRTLELLSIIKNERKSERRLITIYKKVFIQIFKYKIAQKINFIKNVHPIKTVQLLNKK